MFTIRNPRFCYINPQSQVNMLVRNRRAAPQQQPLQRPNHGRRPPHQHPECILNIYDVELLTVPVRLQPDTGVVNCLVSVLSSSTTEDDAPAGFHEHAEKGPLVGADDATVRSAYLDYLNAALQLSATDGVLYEARVSLYDLQTYADILMVPCIVLVKADCDLDSQEEYYDIYFRRNVRNPRYGDMRLIL